MMKLHLGCGKRYIPGFAHVDFSDYAHIDYKRDIGDLSMFEDGMASLIYASHALEYFDREEVKGVLSEWRRVLKEKGILRLAVPDFEALIKIYKDQEDLNRILGPLYGRWEAIPGKWIYHKTAYDFTSLKDLLESNGFRDVRRYDWRETVHKDRDDYSQAYIPHMDKENGLLISLNVEAAKG